MATPQYLATLKSFPRWCRWSIGLNKKGRPTKQPDQYPSQLSQCRDYGTAAYVIETINDERRFGAQKPQTSTEGVGFVFTGGVMIDGLQLFALDIDACVTAAGEIVPEVDELLGALDAPAEATPSGYGLRVWFLSGPTPEQLRRIRQKVPGSWAATTAKKAEIQLFGGGVAQYVTVTGLHIDGTPDDLPEVPWSLVEQVMGAHAFAQPPAPVEGRGAQPTADEVRAAVSRWKRGPSLLTGSWEQHDYESASEAFFALTVVALNESRGWPEPVVEMLLASAWGEGMVESSDPRKYTRERWVRAEVERARAKGAGAEQAPEFGVIPQDLDAVIEKVAPLSSPAMLSAPEKAGPPSQVVDDSGPTPLESRNAEGAPAVGAGQAAASPQQPPAGDLTGKPAPAQPIEKRLFRTPYELWTAPRARDLWQRLLPVDGMSVWYGAPKSGKTYLSIGFGVAVATGTPFLGRSVLQGRVLYVAGEGVGGFADKVAAFIGPERMSDPKDPFHRAFHVLPGMPSLIDQNARERIAREVDSIGGVSLIVIDTLARAIGAAGLDENDQAGMNALVAASDWLRDRCGAARHCVHHENKAGGDRGSTVIRAAADQFSRVTRARRRCSLLTIEDLRDGEPVDPIEVVWEDVEVRQDEHGPVCRWRVASVAAKAADVDPDVDAILAALSRAERPWSASDLAAELPAIGKTKRQLLLKKLLDDGRVERKGSGAKTTWKIRDLFDGSTEPLSD